MKTRLKKFPENKENISELNDEWLEIKELFYNFLYIYHENYFKKINVKYNTNYSKKIIYKANFRNNQNYVLGKNLKKSFLSYKDISENGVNIIGYDDSLKEQKIDIKNLQFKRKDLKISLYLFIFIWFFISFIWIYIKGDFNIFFSGLLFFSFIIYIFLSIFEKEKFILLRDKDKLIVIKK